MTRKKGEKITDQEIRRIGELFDAGLGQERIAMFTDIPATSVRRILRGETEAAIRVLGGRKQNGIRSASAETRARMSDRTYNQHKNAKLSKLADSQADRGARYMPTPEEIAEKCAEIRAGWPEHKQRAKDREGSEYVPVHSKWETLAVKMNDVELPDEA